MRLHDMGEVSPHTMKPALTSVQATFYYLILTHADLNDSCVLAK